MKKDPSIKIIKDYRKVYLRKGKQQIEIGSGTSDKISVFRKSDNVILVLSINYRLGYIGATEYNRTTLTKKKEFFSQDLDDLNEALEKLGMRKKDILDYTDNAIADWISQLMHY